MGLEDLIAGDKGNMEALAKLWGPRGKVRRTHGNADRTKLMVVLLAIDRKLPGLGARELLDRLTEAWAAEEGWDVETMTRFVKAGAKVQVQQAEEKQSRRRGD